MAFYAQRADVFFSLMDAYTTRVQTAIGLAIGLFAAAVVIYPFGKRGYIFAF